MIVLLKDKNVYNLIGYEKKKLKTNFMIALSILFVTFAIVLIFSSVSFGKLFLQMLYYLLYISAIEEILFRGFIQNYLFGFKLNKYMIFVIGAILFSFMHIPFQMFVHNNVSFSYLVEALPNLAETFLFHFIMCFIACKRGDLTIPIAVHCAYDFLGIII